METIIQIIIFQALFIGLYELLFRNVTFFNGNRGYLLITSILSILLPFLPIETLLLSNNTPTYMVQLLQIDLVNDGSEAQYSSVYHFWNPLYWEYLWYLGIGVAAIVFIIKLKKVLHFLMLPKEVKEDGSVIVTVAHSNIAFSFFNYVILGADHSLEKRKNILAHELIHVRERHSLDLLWFEFLRIVFWFNPLVYYYQRRIMEVHEFIADQGVQKSEPKYVMSLLSEAFQVENLSFINQFYTSSLIKKRIIMLKKVRSTKVQALRYVCLIPVVIGMLFYVSCSQASNVDPEEGTTERVVIEETTSTEPKSFNEIDRAPVFPNCDAVGDNESLKKCFVQSMSKFVAENFNGKVGEEYNLKGLQKITVMFTIDANGVVKDITAKTEASVLKEEAIRVMKTLPKMEEPAKAKGKNVAVKYVLPIAFKLAEK